ncbi:MAG: DUF4468 domain-containing protein [Sphingobacteriales bacterium]|nr:MAG: DUF4468 domain-containing protein [Sphingobacteriales bacterium]
MKSCFYFIATLICFTFLSPAQVQAKGDKNNNYLLSLNEKTGKYAFDSVYIFDSTTITQEQAYNSLKNYVVSNLKTSDNNIMADDKNHSEILNTGNLLLKPIKGAGWSIPNALINFKVHVYVKAGRYKVIIDNVAYVAENMAPEPNVGNYDQLRDNVVARKFKGAVNDALNDFVSGLQQSVGTPGADSEKW